MTIFILKFFLQKINLTNNTKNESQLQNICNYPIHPIGSKISSDKRFVNIHKGSMDGSHWVFYYKKDNKQIILL